MYYLNQDPFYVLIGLGMLALVFLIALKVTQQGTYLLWAGGVGLLALLVFGIERFWVTDAERVEAVVYDLAKAVEASDIDRIKSHIDDKISVGTRGLSIDGSGTMQRILPLLKQTRFDFVRVSQLTTSAGGQTKMGQAEFKVTATGVFQEGQAEIPLGSLGTEWSLGFVERSPGVWKVNRITAMKLPSVVSRAILGK